MNEVSVKSANSKDALSQGSQPIKIDAIENNLDVLDPAKNGILSILARIEKNTEAFAKNQSREAAANIRSLRMARAKNPKMKVIPGSTIPVPAPPTKDEAKAQEAGIEASKKTSESEKPKPKQIDSAEEAIKRSKLAVEEYAKNQSSERDSKGRFLPKDQKESSESSGSKGEEALRKREEQEKNKGFLKTVKDSLSSEDGMFSGASAKNEDIGTAVGGPIYSSYKEMSEAYEKLSDPDSPTGKAIDALKGRLSKDKPTKDEAKAQEAGASESKQVVEKLSDTNNAAQEIKEISATQESSEDINDSIDDQTKQQKKNHTVIVKLLNRIRMSTNQGGGGGGLLDLLGRGRGGGLGRGKAGKGGGLLSRTASSVAGKGGGLLRGAASFGSKALGVAAAPIAGMFAYGSKKSELEGREDLTESQKTTQAAATGIGAGGGALAGAAAGAAIGSVVPFVGTLIGGLIGGVVGAYGGEWLGEKAGEAIAGGDGSDIKEKAKDVVEGKDEDLSSSEAKATKEASQKEAAKEAYKKEEVNQPSDPSATSYKPSDNGRIEQSDLAFRKLQEEDSLYGMLAEVAPKEASQKEAKSSQVTEAKEVKAGLSVNEIKTSPITSEMTGNAASKGNSNANAPKSAGNQQQVFDPKAVAKEFAKAINTKQKPEGASNKNTTSGASIIPTEFDDTLMSLISHDRI